ncbi:MAG: Hsp70 family protein [Deltaproteobacteria bacterium]|nr:Hsp70 family protein [Deltaproteobacteria bacterium]
MRKIICGIDLGTTNSSIAYLKDSQAEAIPIEEGQALVPSIVSLDEAANTTIVGRPARNRLAAFPDLTIRSIKRQMGQNTPVHLGAQTFSPEEISSFILSHLAFQASQVIGHKIKEVVITVPAYFNDAQRRATIQAGELAGLEVSRIVNEPTAAALVYDYVSFLQETSAPYIMVYDLGGGTFDVSILEVKGEIKEVLASCGDTALGGDDFDERLVDFFRERLSNQVRGELLLDTGARIRLRDIAEKTKIALSNQPVYQVSEAAILSVAGRPLNLHLEVQRREFEELVVDLVERTAEKVKDALQEARLRPQDIGKILLVGGATRMPVVQDMLKEMFDRPLYHSVDPDLCVALGAAAQGGLISGEPLGHILLDVTAHSLGIRTIDKIDPETGEADYFSVIIRRNTRIPTRQAEMYFTLRENQSAVNIEVFQGEAASCQENTPVGSFDFRLKPAPAHSQILIEFAYDKEGLIHIAADQKGYQNKKEVTLDIRRKEIIDPEISAPAGQVVNYIIEKARNLLAEARLPGELKNNLNRLIEAYEQALVAEQKDQDIDALEDELLSGIEEAEERLSGLG